MTALAERVRLSLAGEIEAVSDALRSALPSARVATWVRGSVAFPYCATIGVSHRDPAAQEVVVITVVGASDLSGGIKFSSDMADGGGLVLSDGPSLDFPAAGSAALDAWVAETSRFIREAVPEAVRIAQQQGL